MSPLHTPLFTKEKEQTKKREDCKLKQTSIRAKKGFCQNIPDSFSPNEQNKKSMSKYFSANIPDLFSVNEQNQNK